MTSFGTRRASRPLRVGQPLVQVLLACLAGLLGSYNVAVFRVALSMHGNDFGKFYEATQNWGRGQSLYSPTIATHMLVGAEWRELLNMNPPHFHLLVLPFVALPLTPAAVAWALVNIAAGAAAVSIATAELGMRVHLRHVLPATCAALLCAATPAIAGTGQFTGLLLIPMVLAWRAARRDRWLRSGAWIGVLVSVKPFFALFLPVLLLRREWRALAGAAAAGGALFATGLVVFGWGEHLAWLHAMFGVDWAWSAMNGSLLAPIARMLDRSALFTPALVRPSLIAAPWLAASAVVLLGTLLRSRRSVDHLFGLTTLGALLISPLGWVYYAWLAFPPCLAIWRHSRPGIVVAGLAALCVPLIALGAGQPSPAATLTIGSSYTWGLLALWIGMLLTPAPLAVRPMVRTPARLPTG
ncbi:MAG: glycosyltransferase family 87 protein [Vicinamibacterales bacterium]